MNEVADNDTQKSDRVDRNISVDLTPHQKSKLKLLAKRSDMKVSEYLRAVITNAIQEEPAFEVVYRPVEIRARVSQTA